MKGVCILLNKHILSDIRGGLLYANLKMVFASFMLRLTRRLLLSCVSAVLFMQGVKIL